MISLDEVDQKILLELRRNARISGIELAKRVGLSNTACRFRINRMENSGIIAGYTISEGVDFRKEDFTNYVLWPLNARSSQDFDEFKKFLLDIDEVVSISLVTGEFDFLVKVSCKNASVFKRVHNKIQSHPLAGKPNTIFVIDVIK